MIHKLNSHLKNTDDDNETINSLAAAAAAESSTIGGARHGRVTIAS